MALGQGVKPPFPRTKTGCLTCRGRKVKCDEAKPSCKTCQRLKLDCRWQTDKNKLGGKSQSTTWTSDLITTTTRKPLTQKTRIPGETFVFEFPNVDRGAMQYIHHYISFCSRFLVYVNDGEGNPFQKELVPFVTTSPALRHSMVALAAGHMSRTDRQHRAKATINYAQALRELKLALEDPVSAKSNSTLGACLLLCVYEITHSDDPSWTKHLEGARDIIRYRGGPDASDFLSRFFALLDISGGLFQGRPPLLEGNYWIENRDSSTSAPSMDGQIMSEVPSASDSPSAASTIPGWPYYDSADVMIQNFHALMTYMARLSQLSSESLTPEGKRDHPRIVEKAMVIQKELFEWWESCPEALRDQSTDWRRQPRPKKLSVAETLEAEAFSSTQSCVYGCILYIAHICDPYSKQPRTTEAAAAIKSLLEIAVETPEGCGLEMGIYFGMFMCGISLFNEEDAENTIRSKLKVENLVSLYHADAALKLLETIWNRQRMFNTKFDWREVQSELKTPVFILT